MLMCNTTLEDDYKRLVKERYEEVKNGDLFTYLESPTRARLSNLCWEIFEGKNMHQDDLNTFNSLLGIPFDLNAKNKFREKVDRFRPIETFFKGETDPSIMDFVNMAAILVDFQPRPFIKYRRVGINEEVYEDESLNEKENGNLKNFDASKIKEKQIELAVNFVPQPARPINLFVNIKQKVFETLTKKLSRTSFFILIVFGLGFLISQYIFSKKQCMQWSGDHYEKVDCDLKADGFAGTNIIEPFDENKYKLKKIKVCDTTRFFNNSNDAIIWYAKKSDSAADFFNTHGRHPETNKPLRPVTKYIVTKYGK